MSGNQNLPTALHVFRHRRYELLKVAPPTTEETIFNGGRVKSESEKKCESEKKQPKTSAAEHPDAVLITKYGLVIEELPVGFRTRYRLRFCRGCIKSKNNKAPHALEPATSDTDMDGRGHLYLIEPMGYPMLKERSRYDYGGDDVQRGDEGVGPIQWRTSVGTLPPTLDNELYPTTQTVSDLDLLSRHPDLEKFFAGWKEARMTAASPRLVAPALHDDKWKAALAVEAFLMAAWLALQPNVASVWVRHTPHIKAGSTKIYKMDTEASVNEKFDEFVGDMGHELEVRRLLAVAEAEAKKEGWSYPERSRWV